MEQSARKREADVANNGLQMPPEQMLDLAHKAAELVVKRIDGLPRANAWEGEFRRELENWLLEEPPEAGRPAAEVIEQAARDILPIATRLDHPRCFGFIPTAPTWPGVLADFMAAGYNANACTWLVASGPSQLELVVIDWLRHWLGYPESAGGLLTSGGSAASLDAFVAAREAAGHPERMTVYMSDQSHSAQVRAAKIIGVRPEGIRLLPSDEQFRLDMETLAHTVAADRAAGAQSHRDMRQRRRGQHRGHRSDRSHSRLLRDRRHLAARRCGVRRLRSRDRAGQKATAWD